MKMRYICIISCAWTMSLLYAAPGQINVQNSNKRVTVQLRKENGADLPGQGEYEIQPNATRAIPVPNMSDAYRLTIKFPDLVGYGGYVYYPASSKPGLRMTNNQLVILPDQTQNYADFVAQKKAQETPEPELPCIGVGC